VAQWDEVVGNLSPDHQAYFAQAIHLCGTPECLEVLGPRVAGIADEREREALTKAVSLDPPNFLEVPPSQTAIEVWWSLFSATGSEDYLKLIVDQLRAVENVGNLDAAVVGNVARWSCVDRGADEEAVLSYLKKRADIEGPENPTLLEAIGEIEQRRKERAEVSSGMLPPE